MHFRIVGKNCAQIVPTLRVEPSAVGSAVEMYLLFRNSVSVNRLYLGTDTRSQCLFIGAALAVALVVLSQRAGSAGRTPDAAGIWRCLAHSC